MPGGDVFGRDEVVEALVAGALDHGVALIGPPGSGLSTVLRHAASRLREIASTVAHAGQVRLVRLPDERLDVATLAADNGVLLVVDDAQLGTDAQLLALRDRALAQPVVLGVRTGAASSQLSWLWRSGVVAAIELCPLADAVVAQIVERRAGGTVHRVTLDGIVHRAAGRPAFAVDETASLLADERLVLQAGLLRG
ncbi:MAG: hypothetical protein ABWZ99_17140, partial [Ilumatobacteraceae bacterium]